MYYRYLNQRNYNIHTTPYINDTENLIYANIICDIKISFIFFIRRIKASISTRLKRKRKCDTAVNETLCGLLMYVLIYAVY